MQELILDPDSYIGLLDRRADGAALLDHLGGGVVDLQCTA